MVTPLLDTPGTTASACAAPIAMVSGNVTPAISFFPDPTRSASHISNPIPIIMAPITYGFFHSSACSLKMNPMIPAGIEPTTRYHSSMRFCFSCASEP